MTVNRSGFRSIVGAVWIVASALTVKAAYGIDNEYSRQSLKGIGRLHVLIEDLTPSTRKAGFRKDHILKDTERKLRLAGIQSLTQNQNLMVKGQPYLYIALSAQQNASANNLIVYYMKVELVQNVLLERDPDILADASTWSIDKIGATHRIRQVRDELNDYIDTFLEAYGSVNAKCCQ